MHCHHYRHLCHLFGESGIGESGFGLTLKTIVSSLIFHYSELQST